MSTNQRISEYTTIVDIEKENSRSPLQIPVAFVRTGSDEGKGQGGVKRQKTPATSPKPMRGKGQKR